VRRVSQWLIFAVLAAIGCGQKPAPVVDLASERQRMVQEQLMSRGVHDGRVLAAMAKVRREEFVPADQRAAAYTDNPLPIVSYAVWQESKRLHLSCHAIVTCPIARIPSSLNRLLNSHS
jgi:hypothetical protein